jgi:hypothetical protein
VGLIKLNNMKITSEQVIEELHKVIDAIGESQNNPDDIAIVTSINGKITSIKYKDLDNYVIRND